jgi:hypothetical protein
MVFFQKKNDEANNEESKQKESSEQIRNNITQK